MNNTDHRCRIPCNSMPLVGEADFGLSLKPIIHCDRTAEYNVLIYVLKGGMEVIEDGIAYDLTPGTLFLLKSGIHHWGEKPFRSGTAWYYIHFYSEEPSETMLPLVKNIHYEERRYLSPEAYQCFLTIPKILKLPVGNEVEKSIEQLINLFQSADNIRTNLALWELLLKCADLEQGIFEIKKEDNRTQKVIEYIECNYCRNFSSAELEKEIGLTYKYISTLFKAKTGITIKEYQLRLRIRKAVRLLCETQLSITEIANETGFYDAFYFSKIFKREKEMSPLKFKETYVPRI